LGFAALAPQAKLGLWLGTIVILATLVQGVAWGLGLEFNILQASGGGRGVLLILALGTLLIMMAADGRPASDYGLVATHGWQRMLLGGFLLGMLAHAAYWAVAVGLGAFAIQPHALEGSRSLRIAVTSMTAFPVSMVQQVIFSGYLLSILRDRFSRITAVMVPALVFALLRRMDDPTALLEPANFPLLIGMFLIASLLGSLRLISGGILLPAGLLAGCIFVRRLLRKTSLLVPVSGQSETIGWLAPGNDPLQGPVMWLILAAGLGLCGVWLWRRKANPPAALPPAVDSSFKRVFPFSNTWMLSPLDVWLGRLWDARFRVGFPYLPRLIAVLVFSTLNTLISLPERLIAPLVLRRRKVADPVVIVGVHRSGTTHLHNLLALDDQFATPRAYQILNPVGFVSSSWLIAPLMAAFLPWRRPMDGVRFHIFAPQEEEFALAGVCRLSPYWALTFPRLWSIYDRFVFPADFSAAELATWKGHLLLLLRKLTFWSGKRPLLKNPYHTARVALLRSMFPGARFIHVYRHPYDVYRSNMHMAREGHVVYQLQDPEEADNYQTRFLGNYRGMEEAFYRESADLPPAQVAEVAFEDLERDPLGEIRRLYAQLGLAISPRFQERLESYLESVADYQKNRFKTLPEQVRQEVDRQMAPFMARWGYTAEGRRPKPADLPEAA
jgi:hypothetical protein